MIDYLNKKTVCDINVRGKTVFLRCDFNVPTDEAGKITDTSRIDSSLKTINYLMERGAKLILCSHLGRPKGKLDPKLSLKPVADYLSDILQKSIQLVTIDNAPEAVKSLKKDEICMLENIRFEPEEEKNDLAFAKKLASLADVYVNDAFGTCHRTHASTAGICKYIPSAVGFLMKKEITALSRAVNNPRRPVTVVLGGAKISDKIGLINKLMDIAQTLIIGGGMSYTFMNALGYSVGSSLCEKDRLTEAANIMACAKDKNVKLLLPVDVKIASECSSFAECRTVNADKIPEGWMGLDIGAKSADVFEKAISGSGTVIWNGTMGVSEWNNFASGTKAVAHAIAFSGADSIVCGGDTASAVREFGLKEKITYISTGGGAALKFLEGESMPALDAIDSKE